jgi:hypothetical protein
MGEHLTVESFNSSETHAVLKESPTPHMTECGTMAGFPAGKGEPTCGACRTALGLPVEKGRQQ